MDHSVDQEISSDTRQAELPVKQAPAAGRMPAYRVWAVCGFLLLAVGLVFGQTVRHQFIGFDDNEYVYENPHITPGLTLAGLWWAVTDSPLREWCPLTAVSHMLDCQLYGLNPAGHYLTNVLLHAASSVLLFLVLLRMTGDLWPSAWVAAVFAIHPLHVESVAWLAERRDMLSGLFFMLTLGAYTLYVERPSLARYLAVALFMALGLMAKPMLVTLPCVLLLLDYWPLDRLRRAAGACSKAPSSSRFGRWPKGWRLVVEKIPLVALAAVNCKIAISSHMPDTAGFPVDRLPVAARLANAVVSYAAYVGQSFYPVDLALFYPHPGTHLPMVSVVGSLVLLSAITAVAAYCWRRLPYLLVGWLWFLGMLVPVIGLVQFGAHARADRYTYLSQIGLSMAVAWGVGSVYQSQRSRAPAPWRGRTLAVVSGAAVLVLAAVAWRQTSYWRNAETLWTHAVACTEKNMLAQYSLAYAAAMQGRIDEAIPHLREAVAAPSIDPFMTAKSLDLLADCLTTQGKTDEAFPLYQQAVRVIPSAPMFHARLALVLVSRGELDRAIVEWRETIRLVPDHLASRLALANALFAHGDASDAAVECREILRRQPDTTEAIVILGAALSAQGNIEEAIALLQPVVESDPRNAPVRLSLGLALQDRGQPQDAIDQLNEAIRLQPASVPILWPAAWMLATSPEPSIRNGARAIGLANRAIQLSGGQEARAFDALAAALAETEKFSAAVDAAERAAAIARARGDAALANAIEERSHLYRQGRPYHQPASPLPGTHALPKAAE